TRTSAASGLTDACTGNALASGSTSSVGVTSNGRVPSGTSGVVANVTVTNTRAQGYLTVCPGSTTKPLASDLNWTPGLTVANLVVAELGTSDDLDFYNAASSLDVIVDLTVWFTP
ncbi:MAG: hypothetical protein ACYDDZ_13685, partial [Acidimicrobiales bacterium]